MNDKGHNRASEEKLVKVREGEGGRVISHSQTTPSVPLGLLETWRVWSGYARLREGGRDREKGEREIEEGVQRSWEKGSCTGSP